MIATTMIVGSAVEVATYRFQVSFVLYFDHVHNVSITFSLELLNHTNSGHMVPARGSDRHSIPPPFLPLAPITRLHYHDKPTGAQQGPSLSIFTTCANPHSRMQGGCQWEGHVTG
jgi:hypothetical protein